MRRIEKELSGMDFKKRKLIRVLMPLIIICLILAAGDCRFRRESREIQNLHALAKLYGYIRYFHPSDEASRVDWEKFAVFGVEKVMEARDSHELRSVLEKLFLPVAPTVRIYPSGDTPPAGIPGIPEDISGLKVVSWQHRGLGFGNANTPYLSIRLNRENVLKPGIPGVLAQGIDAGDLKGKRIRLSARVKADVDGPGNQGLLWLRVDRESGKIGFFDNMKDRPILSGEWKKYLIECKVDDDASMVAFGAIMNGVGRLYLDDFRILVLSDGGGQQTVDIVNPGFETGKAGGPPEGWTAQSPFYTYKIQASDDPPAGRYLLIEGSGQRISGPLFAKQAEAGETVDKELGSNLSARIPLTLYSDENGTLGKDERYSFDELTKELETADFGGLTADRKFVRLADVIIAWNIFQHFYPYFDVVNVDWEEELTNALQSALKDRSEKDFYYTLCLLVAKLQDGHGFVFHPMLNERGGLPLRVDWIENHIVVTASLESSPFQTGDVILSIDGVKAENALKGAEKFLSGSPQWKRWRALQRFGYGERGSTAKIELKRGSEVMEVDVERNVEQQPVPDVTRPPIQRVEDRIFYVDLSRASWPEIQQKIEDLAEAKGVIFDLRGYPNGNHQIICHLLKENDTSKAWMQIPLIIYPDRENIAGYQRTGWGLMAREPHIEGKVVFLVDGRAISYAESFMSFIEYYKLGEIVGQPTAGTNGNVNPFALPGDFRITWTGMRVVKHDGTRHHLIGILPTVPVERTIRGVIEGRDEFFEKALELIKR
jgi:C-terminal processing protease CtpA/Prc